MSPVGNRSTCIDPAHSWSQRSQISLWSALQEFAQATYGYSHFWVLFIYPFSFPLSVDHRSTPCLMSYIFILNRYIFCDDFFGEESIFYEIFAGNFLSVSLFFCDDFDIVSIAVTDLLWCREDIRNILSTSVQIVEPFLARWYGSSTFFR